MRDELQHIISGKGEVVHGRAIQAIARYIATGQSAGEMAGTDKYVKREETKRLIDFIDANQLWIRNIREENYLSQGAEQKVYIKDETSVLKLNDAIYYATWHDYFVNLLLNNYFFPDTAYKLLGLYQNPVHTLFAVVEQPYVEATEKTDNDNVVRFMSANGFVNTKNHDYHNVSLGIILEDLHDQNVLTRNGKLFFIDTVFYWKP